MNSENGLEKQKLLIELENIRNRGIMIFLDGIPSSPLTVTDVLCVNESSDFMRDYVTDEKGVWTELRFDRIKPTQRRLGNEFLLNQLPVKTMM